jgi:hypothetical protein
MGRGVAAGSGRRGVRYRAARAALSAWYAARDAATRWARGLRDAEVIEGHGGACRCLACHEERHERGAI